MHLTHMWHFGGCLAYASCTLACTHALYENACLLGCIHAFMHKYIIKHTHTKRHTYTCPSHYRLTYSVHEHINDTNIQKQTDRGRGRGRVSEWDGERGCILTLSHSHILDTNTQPQIYTHKDTGIHTSLILPLTYPRHKP